MFYIGVDPGLKGAVALLKVTPPRDDYPSGDERVFVFDVPKANREGRIDGYALAETLDYFGVNRHDRVVIEEVQSMPNEGHGRGLVRAWSGLDLSRFLAGVKEETYGNGSRADMNRIMEAAKA